MSIRRWKITPGKLLIAIGALTVAFLALWQAAYPSWADPKNPQYVAWKLGILPMNLDHVMETMVGDFRSTDLVIGKTQDELIKRFGYVTSLDEASRYYKFCYSTSDYKGKQVLFLRRSNWMVVMQDGRAVGLVLMKGC
jgi:hypothetical protein